MGHSVPSFCCHSLLLLQGCPPFSCCKADWPTLKAQLLCNCQKIKNKNMEQKQKEKHTYTYTTNKILFLVWNVFLKLLSYQIKVFGSQSCGELSEIWQSAFLESNFRFVWKHFSTIGGALGGKTENATYWKPLSHRSLLCLKTTPQLQRDAIHFHCTCSNGQIQSDTAF